MKNRKAIAALCLIGLLVSAGCSRVKSQIGLGRQSPDEFAVVKRAPLTLPPDYAVLPEPGSESAAEKESLETKIAAKSALFGAAGEEKPKGSAEDTLLSKMGAATASPDIRRDLEREQGIAPVDGAGIAEKLIFWKEAEPEEEPVVDPSAEKQRLDRNESEGKPVNAGDVPVIEKKKSAIDKLF